MNARPMPKGVNPKLTEEYLMGINDVVDASVYWHEGDLCACVTVAEQGNISDKTLQMRCLEDLGLHQTPRAITLLQYKARFA